MKKIEAVIRPEKLDAVTADEAIDRIFVRGSPASGKNLVIVEKRWDDLFVGPSGENRGNATLNRPSQTSRLTVKALYPVGDLKK